MQVPVGHRAIAGGALEKVDTLPYGHAVWHYRMATPAPLTSLAVATGPYEVRSLTPGRCGDGCPAVEAWSYPGGGGVPAALGRASEMVEFFAARAGRFPYARLAFVAAPAAAAAPGIVFYPEGSSGDGGPPTRFSPWRRRASGSGSRYLRPARKTAGSPTDWQGTSRRSGGTRRASWPGGGARALHRLRGITGDSAFFAGLTRFTKDRLHQSAARADFVRSMSAAAGRDLERDLQQALDRAR